MGAYYQAAIGKTRYNGTGGLKLMEHRYLKNNYVNSVLNILENNPQPLVWLCDYTEDNCEYTNLTWNNTEKVGLEETSKEPQRYILNHTKNLYIDRDELITKMSFKQEDNWYIHPIPILCNSEDESMGGGDLHNDELRRATWCGDLISVQTNKPDESFQNTTNDCMFFED